MKKLFTLFVASMILTFISCERSAGIDTPATVDDKSSQSEETSPIKGVWRCQLNGVQMTLDYGDCDVKYTCYTELFDATAIYIGTYTIKENEIKHEFISLTKKNSSGVEYYSPDKMPKEAVLKDDNKILYMDNLYTRE